eukprot:scaffold786_cov329-Pavlova_lutheri.AAC.8
MARRALYLASERSDGSKSGHKLTLELPSMHWIVVLNESDILSTVRATWRSAPRPKCAPPNSRFIACEGEHPKQQQPLPLPVFLD